MESVSNRQDQRKSDQQNTELTWQAIGRSLISHSGMGLCVIGMDGAVALSNQRMRKGLNLYPGSNIRELIPDLWFSVEKTLNDHQYRAVELVARNGISYSIQVGPILQDNSISGVFCLFEKHSVPGTLNKESQTIDELRLELEGVLDSVSDGIWISDGEGTILHVSRGAEKTNHVRSAEVVGRNIKELLDEGFFNFSTTLEVIRTLAPVKMIRDNRFGRKLMLTGTPVFNATGKLIRVVVVDRDVTEISTLKQELEEQEALKDRMRHELVHLQMHTLRSQEIIAQSPAMIKTLQRAHKVSQVNSTVLILGESGSGKGLIADLIHKFSKPAGQPIIKINCGAIPETLIEMELFGYDKGAFTGARKEGKPGLFELADGGTIFLDEIAELPQSSQVKLLRFLEDGRATRIGGTADRRLDVRVLCATNRDLEHMVGEGKFRLDLFYRLNVIPITVPPLRERHECIPALIRLYFQRFSKMSDIKKTPQITRSAMDALLAYDYPGNVRELMNLCERLVVMAESRWVDLGDLPSKIIGDISSTSPADMVKKGMSLSRMLEEVEKQILTTAGKSFTTQTEIAKALGVNQSTIARKMRKFGIR